MKIKNEDIIFCQLMNSNTVKNGILHNSIRNCVDVNLAPGICVTVLYDELECLAFHS